MSDESPQPERDVAMRYLHALQHHDGAGAAALFCDNGVIDDGNGAHHAGRLAIKPFIDSMRANVVVDVLHVLDAPGRVTVYGYVRSDQLARSMFRWVFHFDGARISHLTNSYLRAFPSFVNET